MLFNIKSLWVRILAETGLVGFAIFLGWLFVIFLSARYLLKNENSLMRTIGWAGIFMLVAMILDGFSVDSFALPYIWATTGLVTAASTLAFTSSVKSGSR
jgi:O-antigen ligase